MKLAVRSLALLLVLAGPAQADVLHLQNGRTLEGRVVKQARGVIKLEVPGGMLELPASTVKRIERRRTPQEEYALRVRRTDTSDPIALDALAYWASKRGLGEQAVQLRAQAKGIRLQVRVDAIRETRRAQDFVEVYHWARGSGYSETVQRWLLAQALEIDAEDPSARRALVQRQKAEEARELARQERADAARRKVEAREQEQLEQDRVSELEERLAKQKDVSDQLRERLDEIERQEANVARHQARIRRRRRRNRGVVLVAPRVIEEPPPVSNPVILVPEPSSRLSRTLPRAHIFPR